MSEETQTMTVTYDISDNIHPKSSGWQNANWLVTIGTVLEKGKFTGVDGNTIEYDQPVVDSMLETAVNKPIHLFHRNREDNERDVGRIFGVFNEMGKGKIKYITWKNNVNHGIRSNEFKLSLEAKVVTLEVDREKREYKAVGGTISGVSLVHNAAVDNAKNEKVSAVALEQQQQVENSANAEPGIRFPPSARLQESDLSPCITLLAKHGINVSKGVTTVTNEGNTEKEPKEDPKEDPKTVEQEKEVIPDPPADPVVEAPAVNMEEFKVMQTKMIAMEKAMAESAGKIATLEGTDMQTIKAKVLKVSPKADFKILLAGEENIDSQKRILNGFIAGKVSQDTPDVNLEGVDADNTAEKPDPKEIEAQYMKDYLGFEENPLAVKEKD